jgi:hypothetical protein
MLALVVGGASGVAIDLGTFNGMGRKPDAIIVCNDIGALCGGFDHWVTLHPEKWPFFLFCRRARNRPEIGATLWSEQECPHQLPRKLRYRVLPDYNPSGLTGLYAIKVAKHIGATKIVLAGVPMDQTGHILPGHGHWINEARRNGWSTRRKELTDVRSMSGWTRQLLGYPTQEWLAC